LSFNNKGLNSVHFAGQGHLPSLELLEQVFWSKVSALEAAERKTGHSLVGPHRDDWAFFLGNQTLKGHGSQGEVRSALLALKLSEIELFRNRTGHRPLFLLDDFSSELDRERRSFLLKYLTETDLQTFVTTTEDSPLYIGKRYWVSNGAIEEGKS
jgi:DNA replication and repair protein RecF